MLKIIPQIIPHFVLHMSIPIWDVLPHNGLFFLRVIRVHFFDPLQVSCVGAPPPIAGLKRDDVRRIKRRCQIENAYSSCVRRIKRRCPIENAYSSCVRRIKRRCQIENAYSSCVRRIKRRCPIENAYSSCIRFISLSWQACNRLKGAF